MLRLASTACPFCEARAVFKAFAPSWQPSRNAATLQKRKPNRMVLSKDVKRGPVARVGGGKAVRRDRPNGPFRGMNVTVAPANLQPIKRTTRITRTSLPTQQQRERGEAKKDQRRTKDPMHAL